MDLEKSFLKTFLGKFKGVSFNVEFWDGDEVKVGEDNPKFKIILHKPLKKKDILTSTTLAFGEAYMKGDIEIEGDLFTVFDELLKCIDEFSTNFGALTKIFGGSTSMKKQKEEVTSHYDIGNDFYKMWLDETMSYSCGYFKNENDTLYQAQCNKVDRILEKLNLSDGMTLCDIGCGWGFLLIEAAKKYNIKGVGITLSKEQKAKFEQRIKEENLSDRLEVKLLDYRDLPKQHMEFDRVVSVGMIEHVGRGNYEEFMQCVKSVLKQGGVFVLHFISALKEYPGDAWVKKYIFPGGVIPSLREIMQIAGELRFYTVDVESLRRHYNKTLLCWNENFQQHRVEVVEMFDEKFARMWELYLCACAATFMNGIIDLHQIVFTNDVNNELPMTRWY